MSAFTNATSSSGILRSEIPQQCLTEIKTGVMDMLDSFCEQKVSWSKMIDCIKIWSPEDINDEVQALLEVFPDAKKNFQYTILKAVKNISVRNGSSNMKVKMSKLAEISFEKFYKDFTQTIVNMPDMKSKQRYSALRPSDKEIIARDAFRRTLYSHSRDLFGQLTSVPTIAEEKASPPPPTSQNTIPIGFEDSVSQAPSEVISIRQSSDERISNSILKLHIENGEQDEIKAGGQENIHEVIVQGQNESKMSYKKIPSIVSRKSKNDPYFFSAVSRKSRMTNKSEDVINIDIASSTKGSTKGVKRTTGIRSTKGVRSTKESVASRKTSRSKSHFSRSPKVEAPPCFFDEDDGINLKDADVATFV